MSRNPKIKYRCKWIEVMLISCGILSMLVIMDDLIYTDNVILSRQLLGADNHDFPRESEELLPQRLYSLLQIIPKQEKEGLKIFGEFIVKLSEMHFHNDKYRILSDILSREFLVIMQDLKERMLTMESSLQQLNILKQFGDILVSIGGNNVVDITEHRVLTLIRLVNNLEENGLISDDTVILFKKRLSSKYLQHRMKHVVSKEEMKPLFLEFIRLKSIDGIYRMKIQAGLLKGIALGNIAPSLISDTSDASPRSDDVTIDLTVKEKEILIEYGELWEKIKCEYPDNTVLDRIAEIFVDIQCILFFINTQTE